MTNAIGESISSVTMWNIVNQLGKYEFSCGAVVNNLKNRELVVIKRRELVLTQFLLDMTGIVPACRI